MPSRTSRMIGGDLSETFGMNSCGFGVGGPHKYYQRGAEREGTLPWHRLIDLLVRLGGRDHDMEYRTHLLGRQVGEQD